MDNYGILSIVPVIIVIAIAVATKRTITALVIGGIVGAIIAYGKGFITPWVDALYGGLSDSTWQWMALVCGLFGSLVALLQASRSVYSFTEVAARYANSKRKSLVTTFILGCIIFVDDWLDVLVCSHAMKGVTDKNRVPREMLAYIITAHGANVCVLIPFSTWAAFFAGQYEANGLCGDGEGMSMYISSIPFMFFSSISLIICFLICMRWFPLFGPMKLATQRADAGEVLPPLPPEELAEIKRQEDSETSEGKPVSFWNFLIPIIVLAILTIVTGEILYGVMCAIITCAILFFPQRLLTLQQFCGAMLDGFKDMIGVIGIVYAAFVLRTFNEELGLTDFVIGLVDGKISAGLLPAVVFIVIAALIFAAGNFWGMAAITFPVVVPMGVAVGADMTLLGAAIVCATTFGATACFYGSEVSLTCAAVNVPNMTYVKTAYPIIAVSAGLAFIAFVIAGMAL